METAGPDLFATSEALEEYSRRVADRLTARLRDRVTLLEQATERLDAMLRAADALEEEDVRDEVVSHLAAGREELGALRLALDSLNGGSTPYLSFEVRPTVAEPPAPAPAPPEAVLTGAPNGQPADRTEELERWLAGSETPGKPAPEPEQVPIGQMSAPEHAQAFAAELARLHPEGTAAEPEDAEADDWDLDFAASKPSAGAAAEEAPPDALRLEVVIGECRSLWTMKGDTVIIGRRDPAMGKSPDLDLWPDRGVSRRHARITRRDGRHFFADLNSVNGTLLNGELLTADQETEIRPGDEILVGEQTTLRVRKEDEP